MVLSEKLAEMLTEKMINQKLFITYYFSYLLLLIEALVHVCK